MQSGANKKALAVMQRFSLYLKIFIVFSSIGLKFE